MKAVALFPIFLFFFLFVFLTPSLAYYDIDTTGDATVYKNSPSSNYGSETYIAMGGLYNSSLLFNLSIIPFTEDIIGAELFVQEVGGTNTSNISVYNTSYFNEYNITYSNQPIESTFYSSIIYDGVVDSLNVTNAVITSHSKNETIYLKLLGNDTTGKTFRSREWGSNLEPYLRVYTASGSGCTSPDSYVTGSACLDADTYYTSDGCNYNTTDCPSGSTCVQLTPQMNVTSDLYENFTSCEIVTNIGLRIQCWNVCFWGSVIWTNCVETDCQVCPDERGGFSIDGTYGFYTNTWYSNQSDISVSSWTVACHDTTSGDAVLFINSTGGNTTEIEILTQAGNNVSEVSPSGEAPLPEDEGTSGLREWLNAGMGSSFGSDIISLIVAGVCSILVFINVSKDDKSSTILFGTFILVASAFSFVGLLTMWFLVLEVTLIGVLIFWKVRGG